MIMHWLSRFCRRVMTPAVPASVNPNPAPAGPSPIVQTKPKAVPTEPDLEFVGTRDLYSQIATRYDGSVLVCVRRTGRPDGAVTVVFLANGIDDVQAFLHGVATLAAGAEIRDIREDDL